MSDNPKYGSYNIPYPQNSAPTDPYGNPAHFAPAYGQPHPHMNMHPHMYGNMHPHMNPQMHAGGMHPNMYANMHPQMHAGSMHPNMYANMNPNIQTPQQPEQAPENDAFVEQAQAMLEGVLGEEVGMFKELLGNFGMNDKEFWKGAMVGAAAAMLLSNENVRGKLVDLVSGAGDMLKSGGSNVKQTATQTATNVKETVATNGEIFRDTYAAGKQGFQDSVERHNHTPEEQPKAES